MIEFRYSRYYKNNQKKTFLSYENLGGVANLKKLPGISTADEYVMNELIKDRDLFISSYPGKSFRAKFYSVMKERMDHFKKIGLFDDSGKINQKVLQEKKKIQKQR